MDAIGNIPAVILPRQSAAPASQSAPSIKLPDPSGQPILPIDNVSIDAPAGEQVHYETVHSKTEDIANPHVLGDQKFTMYKDATGQLITRFTTGDGKVTYIPEPSLFKMGGSSSAGAEPSLTIIA